jgi:hypothetical protein
MCTLDFVGAEAIDVNNKGKCASSVVASTYSSVDPRLLVLPTSPPPPPAFVFWYCRHPLLHLLPTSTLMTTVKMFYTCRITMNTSKTISEQVTLSTARMQDQGTWVPNSVQENSCFHKVSDQEPEADDAIKPARHRDGFPPRLPRCKHNQAESWERIRLSTREKQE